LWMNILYLAYSCLLYLRLWMNIFSLAYSCLLYLSISP
jgi:hypothetical protein